MFKLESNDGVVILADGTKRLRIAFVTDAVARLTFTDNKPFKTTPSLIVTRSRANEALIPFGLRTSDFGLQTETPHVGCYSFNENDADFTIATKALKLVVSRQTGAISYFDAKGKLLMREPDRGGKWLTPKQVFKNVYSKDVKVASGQSIDGARAAALPTERIFDRNAFEAKLEFVFSGREALFGLGSHEEGYGNLRGKSRELYQQNMKAVVPYFVSTKGYGILLDCCSLMTFHDDAYGSYLWADVVDELDYYFIRGERFDDITRGYHELTGKVPMLPKWAFGYAQSKERYVNAAEMVSVVREYRRRKIPLDLIVLDWKSWPAGSGWGQKSFDPVRFPDPETFTNELHKLGARLMISIWPIMTGDCPNQRELLEGGLMLGNQSTYDAFNEEARKVYWEQANRGLFSKGIDAWWCDCTEPFEADWSGAVKPEADARLAINTEQSKRYIDAGYINAYSLLHSKGIYEGQRRVTRDKRVINLTRSSYAGQHRYATITWSGDICATWETLRRSIPEGLNFCAAGEPYWTLDIGGFFIKNDPTLWFWHGDYDAGCRGLTGPDNTEPDPRDTGCTDPGFHELYTRWLQYAVFLPMFRSHGTDAAREIWRFGDEGNPFYDTIAKYIRLRYQLIPYIYSLAAQVTLNSYTLLRAVALDFSEDEATHNLTDQFLFGSAFMVCPVTNPMYYSRNSQPIGGDSTGEVASPSPVSRSEPLNSGAPPHPSLSLSGGEGGRRPGEGVVHGEGGRGLTTGSLLTRPVYLPKGSRWYDFWTEKVYEGGQTINAAAPLETIPLFVRAGAIVPMSPVMQYVDETPDAPYEIRIYDGADGEFFLYEDAGDNYDYEKGIYSLVKLSWNDRKGELVISERKGSFKGIVSERDFQIVLISEKGKEMKNVIYTGKETAVRGSRSG